MALAAPRSRRACGSGQRGDTGTVELVRYRHGTGRLSHGVTLIADLYNEGDREWFALADPTTILALIEERDRLAVDVQRFIEAAEIALADRGDMAQSSSMGFASLEPLRHALNLARAALGGES